MSNDQQTLQSKVAVITGGSRGIGLACAQALVDRGAKVVLGDILDTEGNKATANLNKNGKVAVYCHTDVTKYSDLIKLFQTAEKEFGGVDIAFLNAGVGSPNILFSPLDDDADMLCQEINLGGVIKGNKVAALHMAQRGGGVIVNTASMAGFLTSGVLGAYNASKHGVIGWTRSMDLLHQIANIRTNAICPFWVQTDILKGDTTKDNEFFQKFIEISPKSTMEGVVEAFLKCCMDDSVFGQTLAILPDGVHTIERPPVPESCQSKKLSEYVMSEAPSLLEQAKTQLENAITTYKKNYSKL
ncbi:NAD(P)-binding protein [Backusella circina FSU 941]|nr:NAD(P)-binding protein [Backusella circina FSU 941]